MMNPSREAVRQRFDLWQERHGWRLAEMHPDVAAEVASTVRERIYHGEHAGLTDEDRRQCLMRVASRMRVKAGNIPAGEPGSGEQLRAIVAELQQPQRQAAA